MSCKKKKTDIYIFTNIQQTKKKNNNPGKKKNSGHEMNEFKNGWTDRLLPETENTTAPSLIFSVRPSQQITQSRL